MSLSVLLMLAQAATVTPTPAASSQADSMQRPKMICVVEDGTGSRLSAKRVCRSKTEWDAVKGEITENLNLRQRNTIK